MLVHERRLLPFHEVKVLPQDTIEMRLWDLNLQMHRTLEALGGRLDGFNIDLGRLLDPNGSLAVTVPPVGGNPAAQPPTTPQPGRIGLAENAAVSQILEAKSPGTVLTGVTGATDIRTLTVPSSELNILGNHVRVETAYTVTFTAPGETLQVGVALNEFNSTIFTLVARVAGTVDFTINYEAKVTEASDQVALPTNGMVVTNIRIVDSRGYEDFGRTLLSPINLYREGGNNAFDWVVGPSAAGITTTLESSRVELLRGDC